ncbi:class I adenylate-forming enzyme family protein [Methylocapsa sp. S129]|uniref:class I adenylate-forming enzyme family protein n=1 Tax=Methylocapsa sp. S129 TaxID=1641869 RepID=UPI001AEEDCD3|nr:AMP-binding protein [Methylocapsa sp. S129]
MSLINAAATQGPTVWSLFADATLVHRDAYAVEDKRVRLTYRAFRERVERLAGALLARGARHGDRVAILSENRCEYLEVQLACAKLGLIAACPNWRQTGEELARCIALVSPILIFASPRFEATLEDVDQSTLDRLVFEDSYEKALADAPGLSDSPVGLVAPEDGLLILYTSGTTGSAKGALISHRAMIARAMTMMADWSIDASRGFIAWAPLFHMASADPSLSTLCQGAKVTIIDGFDAEAIAATLARESVGWFVLMPGMIERMSEALRRLGTAAKGVAAAGCMANLIPGHQIAEITRLVGAPFLNSFGSTETGIAPASRSKIPIGVVLPPQPKLQSSFCQIRLVNDEDEEVAVGEVGEMSLRSPTLFSGYWNAPEVNAREFRGGWFHMGDDFVRNPDGTLDFVDRRKYLIKSGGENIYPAEIERILLASDRVSEAVVVRKRDEKWGEIPVLLIVARDPTLRGADVMDLLNGRIARFKLPKDVLFIADEELSRNATGKIRRDLLERRVADRDFGGTKP